MYLAIESDDGLVEAQSLGEVYSCYISFHSRATEMTDPASHISNDPFPKDRLLRDLLLSALLEFSGALDTLMPPRSSSI